MAAKGGLGRGLDTLFGENTPENSGAVTVRITDIEPNRDQPRKDFDEQALAELADSITKHGLLQPIIVRPLSTGSYHSPTASMAVTVLFMAVSSALIFFSMEEAMLVPL